MKIEESNSAYMIDLIDFLKLKYKNKTKCNE